MKAREFKNIIFDLGGVIINLDEKRTVKAFAQLSSIPESFIEEHMAQSHDYHLFEKGLIPDHQFRDALRKEFKIEAGDHEIDSCMNAMLLDIPVARMELLSSLNQHALYLLSNTNEIHLERFNQIFQETMGRGRIDDYFNKVYYSHLVKMRKPEKEIFEMVLTDNKLVPDETLFLDDNPINLEGAQSVGIHTFHIKNSSLLFDLFQ